LIEGHEGVTTPEAQSQLRGSEDLVADGEDAFLPAFTDGARRSPMSTASVPTAQRGGSDPELHLLKSFP